MKAKTKSYNGIISCTGLGPVQEKSIVRKTCFLKKPCGAGPKHKLSVTPWENLLEQKSQDYGPNIKKRAKRRLKTLYEVYIAVLMVQSDRP